MKPIFFLAAFLFVALQERNGFAEGVVRTCDEASLRAALEGGGVVTFECDGTITLTKVLLIRGYASNDASGNRVAKWDTTIDGNGHRVTISGGNGLRLFELTAKSVRLTLKGITLADAVDGATGGRAYGAAIHNPGTVSIRDCMIRNCKAYGGGFGVIQNLGVLEVQNSSFFDSYHTAAVVANYGKMGLTNCTFYNNGGWTTSVEIRNASSSDSYIVNCTFAGSLGGHVSVDRARYSGKLTAINSIFINVGATTMGLEDGGHNISNIQNPDLNQRSSIYDPQLGVLRLGANGGPTWTAMLPPNSKAIDAGNDLACPATDQRGVLRPRGRHCDLGAVEVDSSSNFTGTIQFAEQNYFGFEDQEYVAIRVIRTGDTSGYAQAIFDCVPITATPDSDYVRTTGPLTFTPGQTEQTFFVPVLNYDGFGSDETVLLTLSSPPPGNTIGVGQATLTLRDEVAVVQFAAAEFKVPATASNATITLERTGNPRKPAIVVVYAYYPNAHFEATQVSFASGQTSASFSLRVNSSSLFLGGAPIRLVLDFLYGFLRVPNPNANVFVEGAGDRLYLRSIVSTGDGSITLRGGGKPGQGFSLSSSDDLREWSTGPSGTVDLQGGWELILPASIQAQFYRVLQ